MRRFSIVLLVLFVSLAAAFAVNSQKIYSVDTDIYRTISQIYVLTGHALPSSAGPWSADELLSMYEAIDRSDVPSFMQARYDEALAELTDTIVRVDHYLKSGLVRTSEKLFLLYHCRK